jgi:hypothetical protein
MSTKRRWVAGAMAVCLTGATSGYASGMDTPTAARGTSPFRCGAGETKGLPPEDAATAVDIVCREVASVSGSSGAYVVSVRPLGQSVVLTVAHAGTADGRSLVLDGFKEVPTAARRLAEAVVLGKAIEDTRLVDNLVASEGRKLVTQSGSRKFELGAFGLGAGQGTGMGGGFSVGFAYETPRFAIPAELRWAASSDSGGDRDLQMFAVETGARYYLSAREVSPFLGGGLSVLRLSLSDHRDRERYVYLQDSHWGPGFYAEAGVQLFRFHRGRLTAKVRAEFPLYTLHPEGFDYQPSERGAGRQIRIDGGKRYVVPITFGVTMSF